MYLRALKKVNKEVSLYDPIGNDKEGNEIRIFDILESEQNDIVEKMAKKDDLMLLKEYIKTALTDMERNVLYMRYGIGYPNPMTQNEIAAIYHISRSYVSRIEKKALFKLRKQFEA